MGLSPAQVDGMSLWEFAVVVDGWNEGQGVAPEPEPPSIETHLAMVKAAREMRPR